ncbi:histidine kinase, partial [Phocaeicola vulgatus]|uniref:histidine kinase n=1 Tax=Phocaeicola vulgatus TaxID=821 RepID=UPI0021AA1631
MHLATQAKTELLVTLVVPDPLAQLAPLDFKELLANLAPMVILADRDLKETLELLVMLEPQAKMDTPAHLARSLVHLVPSDLLVHLATMALLARMVSLAALDTQAKMESPELLDTLVHLANQVNPHFFFNSLNGISSLIRKKNDENTLTYVNQLSDIFRYILQSDRKGVVTLREELEFIQSFRYVMEVRFANKLSF